MPKKEEKRTMPVLTKGRKKPVTIPEGYKTLQQVTEKVETEHIRKTLELTHWNLQKTSRVLDIARNTLKAKIKKFNIHQIVNGKY